MRSRQEASSGVCRHRACCPRRGLTISLSSPARKRIQTRTAQPSPPPSPNAFRPEIGILGMLNNQGRPTHSAEASASDAATFTGNRALDMEEALIFETGRLDATGVDIDAPEPFADRLRDHPPVAPRGPP